MIVEVMGTVEQGALKLDEALPFPDQTRVKLKVQVVEPENPSLAAYTGKRKRQLPKGVGKYSSGYSDTAQKVDEILSAAVKEGLWP